MREVNDERRLIQQLKQQIAQLRAERDGLRRMVADLERQLDAHWWR